MSVSRELILASLDLSGCAYRGAVLSTLEKDQSVENQYFKGWRDWLNLALHRLAGGFAMPQFGIAEDGGRPALENTAYKPFLLLAGSQAWSDVTVESELRCLTTQAYPYGTHDEIGRDYQARIGVAFRVQDVRRHYFCGFQNGARLVIAARENAEWIILNSVEFPVDPDHAYRLEARCEGDLIEAWADGERRLSVRDRRWLTGPAGLYGNTYSHFWSVTVRASEAEVAAIATRVKAEARELAAAKTTVPAAKIQQRVTIPMDDRTTLRATGFRKPLAGILPLDKDCVVVQWTREGRAGLIAVDIEGKERWRCDLAPAGALLAFAVCDLDMDGAPELLVRGDNEIVILEGASGKRRCAMPFPEGDPFLVGRHERMVPTRLQPKIYYTAGRDRPPRIVLIQDSSFGGLTIWSCDHQLKLRWTHRIAGGRYGHDVASYDINGDGRDEIVASYYALDDDGKLLWKVRGHDRIPWNEHADRLAIGPKTEDGRTLAVVVCGTGGVIFLDVANGEILAQFRNLGHVQGVVEGNFLHDRPGLEAWVWTDWGSWGIYYLFDAAGNILHRFQPDPRAGGAAPVRWWADGRDLLLMQNTREALGLWDAHGRRVVSFAEMPGCPAGLLPTETGLPMLSPIVPCGLRGATTDSLLAVAGREVLLIGPDK